MKDNLQKMEFIQEKIKQLKDAQNKIEQELTDNFALDITLIGSSTERALCKGYKHVRFAAGISCAVGMDSGGNSLGDSNSMDILYETLPLELDKIITSPSPEQEIESQKQGVQGLIS